MLPLPYALPSCLPIPLLGVLQYLALINLLLGAFNLIPAFPMDGGRVLRAALWHWRGDFRQATRVATNAGKGFGMLLMALGVLSVVTGNFIGGMWWFQIGRASGRERVCQYVEIAVLAVSLKKKTKYTLHQRY